MREPDLPKSAHIVRLVDPNMSHALSQWVILNIMIIIVKADCTVPIVRKKPLSSARR